MTCAAKSFPTRARQQRHCVQVSQQIARQTSVRLNSPIVALSATVSPTSRTHFLLSDKKNACKQMGVISCLQEVYSKSIANAYMIQDIYIQVIALPFVVFGKGEWVIRSIQSVYKLQRLHVADSIATYRYGIQSIVQTIYRHRATYVGIGEKIYIYFFCSCREYYIGG